MSQLEEDDKISSGSTSTNPPGGLVRPQPTSLVPTTTAVQAAQPEDTSETPLDWLNSRLNALGLETVIRSGGASSSGGEIMVPLSQVRAIATAAVEKALELSEGKVSIPRNITLEAALEMHRRAYATATEAENKRARDGSSFTCEDGANSHDVCPISTTPMEYCLHPTGRYVYPFYACSLPLNDYREGHISYLIHNCF